MVSGKPGAGLGTAGQASRPGSPHSRTDQELVRQTQGGSLPAFEELVYRYEGRIYAFVANFCRNTGDAREVTQDTFVRAFQGIARFDCQRDFAPWLFTIARSKCVDHRRRAPPAADGPMPELACEDTPADALARREQQQDLWGLARRCLPEMQFQALWLRYVDDLSIEAIAQALGKTRTHIKVLLFRARQALAPHIKPAPGKDSYEIMARPHESIRRTGRPPQNLGLAVGKAP
jgi:RNA polymerase sigma-70 factor, ECF subfamily